MFKRKVEDSGKCPVWRFAFRIFYAHIANVLIMLVAAMLVENLGLVSRTERPESHPLRA